MARAKRDPAEAADAEKAKNQEMIQNGIRNGRALKTDLTVRGNVKVQAVLIPQVDARRMFGKEIANNYAVIAVTVSNKSPDAALIIHGAYIDYQHWGMRGGEEAAGITAAAQRPLGEFEAETSPNEVASVDSRLVRGQLLDAQQGSARNWTIRLLTLAGSLASGYSFAFSGANAAKGIAAFNGNFVPGLGTAWPDQTVPQLNRISDFGYQTNKVIPKQGADVMVCFFPIDRFLTPGFRKLFLQSPAVFFAPLQMLYDPEIVAILDTDLKYVIEGGGVKAADLRQVMPGYIQWRKALKVSEATKEKCKVLGDNESAECTAPSPDACDYGVNDQAIRAITFINTMSLNTVTVVVEGVMSVDTTQIAAKIDSVTCEDNGKPAAFWGTAGVRKCSITGSYLTGGELKIAEAQDQKITDVAVIADGSSDTKLNFSFKLTQGIATGTKVHFVVSKKSKDTKAQDKSGTSIDSNEYEYVVMYTLVAPTVASADAKDGQLTVSGTGFFDLPGNARSLILHREDSSQQDVMLTLDAASTDQSLVADLSRVTTGCYTAKVGLGTMTSNASGKVPIVKMDSATRSGSQILVAGSGFSDAGGCTVKLTFKLESGATTQDAVAAAKTATQVKLTLPDAAKTGAWTVRMLVGKDEKGTTVDLK